MRLGILTGGGDCPGLNAVVRAIVRRGLREGHELVGIGNGFEGLMEPGLATPLSATDVRGILPKGGTILGTSNKANPFAYPERTPDGRCIETDQSARAVARYHDLGLDGLICIGGDGTLSTAHRLSQLGLRVVGCPKTIDNDLSGTDQTFGFDTAVGIISEAIDRLHSTAEAHQRVMVIEIMGRNAGFLTLDGGIAGGADVILLPEQPYRVPAIVETLKERWADRKRRRFSIIAISEGAYPEGGSEAIAEHAHAIPGRGVVRLGGAGKVLADLLAPHVDAEIRVMVLGHLQRGGTPSSYDRVLATMCGALALDLVRDGRWDHMVCLRDGQLGFVSLAESRKERKVDMDGTKVRLCRSMGISFG